MAEGRSAGTTCQVDLTGPQASWPAAALRLWRNATDRVLGMPGSWNPPPIQGDQRLREVLGGILHEDPGEILITSGVRAGASVIGLGRPRVLHEHPSFSGTVQVLRSVRSDVDLLTWDELLAPASVAGAHDAGGVVWLTSPCRNPDGATLSADEWGRIEALAQSSRVVVNEVYRWFGNAAARPARVWMTGSLSKLAGSGAGLGWIRGSGVGLLADRQHARPSLFWQRCWCYLLEHGGLDAFVNHTVRPAAAASEAFVAELRRYSGVEPRSAPEPGSPFLLLPVPPSISGDFIAGLAGEGIRVGAGSDFLAPWPSIRVCFVAVSEADARHAARVIGARLGCARE
jgi:DNA-binding transcriptional MocR family regulator